jgi:hypothetical protein
VDAGLAAALGRLRKRHTAKARLEEDGWIKLRIMAERFFRPSFRALIIPCFFQFSSKREDNGTRG